MAGKLLLAVIAVAVIGYILARLGQSARASWFLVRIWRWLSGEAHHGKPITDAGWFRAGKVALTPTGHATRWWHRPRWQRAAIRSGYTFGLFAVLAGFLVAALVTAVLFFLVVAGHMAWAGIVTHRKWRIRQDRKTWLYPLHLAAHRLADVPRAALASSWLEIETGDKGAVQEARLKLPPGWPADEKDKQRLVAIASAKLGIEGPEPSWRLAGPAPMLTLTHSPPPPERVKLADVLDEIRACKDHELFIGIGKNDEPIRVSLATDSPHIALNMGTGAGKSNLAGFLLFQRLIIGDIGSVLDAKRRLSYPWLLKDMDRSIVQLPNVAYAWTTEQIHAAMSWMSAELDRRGDVAFAAMDTRGEVHANVGARLFTIAEELNLAVPRLRAYWQENREPGDPSKSPAFTGLGEVAFAGRQVRKHLILVGQMLTAEATGSRDSSVKENCGIKLLARYGPKGWRMMAEDIPMPPPPTVTGRVQVVAGGQAREVQTPKMDPQLARQMVLDGVISALPWNMPCGPPRPVTETTPPMLDTGPDQGLVTVPVTPRPLTGGEHLVGLSEAKRLGLVHENTTVRAMRQARWRAQHGQGYFPEARSRHGAEDLYEARELTAWDAGRR